MTRPVPHRTIAVTGASGFVGSALVSTFLLGDEPLRILSLAHDDPDGSRVRQAVARALAGFNGSPDLVAAIEPVAIDLTRAEAASEILAGIEADELWHVAAHMSYDPLRIAEAFAFNAVGTTRLMRATGRIGRFYFVSTTGVAGPGDRDSAGCLVPERPLEDFEAINPYTVSKTMAEYMLWHVSSETGIPLTVLRLGSVIGHSVTGWVNDTRYGYYSYLQAFKRFLGREPAFHVDIDPERTFPVIHIDHMGDLCARLRRRAEPGDREVFHICDTGLMTVAEHFRTFEEVTGGRMRIAYGPGEKSFNQVFNKVNADNNRFMGTRHSFDMRRLAEAVGDLPRLERSGLEAVITAYVNS